MYVCICNAVTDRQLEDCARAGARSLDELAFQLGIGTGCGRCRDCASGVLREIHSDCDCELVAAK